MLDTPAHECLNTILQQYNNARAETLRPQHPVVNAFALLQRWLEHNAAVRAHPELKIRWSTGVGTWAKVPWLALLDTRETSTTQRGVYCSLLFRTDMGGAYLALEHGVRELSRSVGASAAQVHLEAQSALIRPELSELQHLGFAMHGQIDLGDGEQTSQHAVVAHKFYTRGALPDDAQIASDLAALLHAYGRALEKRTAPPTAPNGWLFQANPQTFNVRGALHLKEFTWPVKQHAEAMRAGDRVYFWESGRQGGLVGVGTLLAAPEAMAVDAPTRRRMRKGDKPSTALRVRVQPESGLAQPVPRAQVQQQGDLADLGVLRTPMAVNFPVTPAHQLGLDRLLKEGPQTPPPEAAPARAEASPRAVADAWIAAFAQAGWHGGPTLTMQLQVLVSALLSGPPVLMCGSAGVGKSTVTQQLAHWVGADRARWLQAPGSTDVAWLLGQANGPASKGRVAWETPPALQLVHRAAQDARQPYLLVVDGLPGAALHGPLARLACAIAHGEACVPAVRRDPDGTWRAALGKWVRWPANMRLLMVCQNETWVGAPLDAWHVLPWRAPAAEMPARYTAAADCQPATTEVLRAWLQLSQDATWHHAVLDTDNGQAMAAGIHALGRLCERLGMPLGHRYFMQAPRLAAMFARVADASADACLDQVFCCKVLPQLRAHRHAALGPLLQFTFDLSVHGQAGYDPWAHNNAPARLPLAHQLLQSF